MSDEYQWRDLGDGNPIRVQKCSMCDVAPSNVDDCGCFGDPNCPYFGIGEEEFEKTIEKLVKHMAKPSVLYEEIKGILPIDAPSGKVFYLNLHEH